MPFRSVVAVLIVAGVAPAWADSPCGTLAANRNLTGNWNGYTAAGAVAAVGQLVQIGNTVTGGYQETAAVGHPNLVLTFKSGSIVKDMFSADYSATEGTVTASGHVDATLSLDGNSLTGTY